MPGSTLLRSGSGVSWASTSMTTRPAAPHATPAPNPGCPAHHPRRRSASVVAAWKP